MAESGAVMVARTEQDLKDMLIRGLSQPKADSRKRRDFIKDMFGDTLRREFRQAGGRGPD